MTVHSEVRTATGIALSWRQLTGAAGIASVVLSVLMIPLVGDYPDINKSAAEVRTWFADNGTTAQTASYLNALGTLFLFAPFLLGMRSLLGRAEGYDALAAQLGLFGGAIFVVLNLSLMAYVGVLAVAVESLDDSTVVALKHAEYIIAAVAYGLASALYLIGTGVAIVRTGALWRWLGGVSIALGIIALIGSADIIDPDPESPLAAAGFLAGAIGLWVVIVLQGVGLLTGRTPDLEPTHT